MTKYKEEKPERVSNKTNPSGDIRDRWSWVEPSVWTNRMLTTLEKGVKGGKWFSLIDKVYTAENLQAAFRKVYSNKGTAGVDHQTVGMYKNNLESNISKLILLLGEDEYRPQKIKRIWVPKPGVRKKRPLGIPTVQDRVVQTALRNVIEPIFENDFAKNSFGFRPGRSCKDALREVDNLLKSGYVYVLDADISNYFDSINHEKLIMLMRAKVTDSRVLKLVEMFLRQNITEGLQEWTPQQGSPQGAVLSPLLSNIYLDPLDHLMNEAGYKMIRYADDFIIHCKNRQEAEKAIEIVDKWLKRADLVLNEEKTRIVDAREEPFEFLGYKFKKGRRWPADKSLKKLKDKIRAKTKRINGNSMTEIVKELNPMIRGWFEYYKHCGKFAFSRLDQWIRMRLRSILRKRTGRKGRGRGKDHNRWPNSYFTELGLFSLVTAHESVRQSSLR